MIGMVLAALKFAPAVFSAGKDILEAVTGEAPSGHETPESLAAKVEALPPEQCAAVTQAIMAHKEALQKLDTQRFLSLNEGDAEKVRASARPEIARQAMAVISIFAWCFRLLIIVTIMDWLVRFGYAALGEPFPIDVSVWDLMAQAQPVTELIWAPLIASFWACVEIIKKYMGCRERDKAQQFEMQHGSPLQSSAATVEAAGSGLAGVIRAVRGK